MKYPTESHSGRTAKMGGEYGLSHCNTDDAHLALMLLCCVKQPQQFAGGPLNFVVCQVRSPLTLL